ncbi:MAG: phospholipase [Nocardioides sp.]|nr:phospholipase [Nocardioides sp.]
MRQEQFEDESERARALDPQRPDEPRDWLLTREERDNPHTRLDERHGGDVAWSTGNLAEPLIDGASYFAALLEELRTVGHGDVVLFTDWQGDAGQRLSEEAGTEVVTVLGEAQDRGAEVRGLVWRSHTDQVGFFAEANRHLGEQLRRRGVPVMLDMRVKPGGAHHQKFVVVRRAGAPERDVAFVGGIDLAHNRRDDQDHDGDPQGRPTTEEYGEHAPWHDVQVRLRGPVVHDVETVFRERWEDPSPPSVAPWRHVTDRVRDVDTSPVPLSPQLPAPPPAGPHTVQLLRTYPALGAGRAHPFAPRGERSVARGYRKALANARELVYIEDQYFWDRDVAAVFAEQLRANPRLHLLVVIPLHPDKDGLNRVAQHLGRDRAINPLMRVAPGRVAAYGLENPSGRPVYVHAKVTVVDDTWATTGSDNFNRRSWTHDAELTAAVLDRGYARDLRLRLAAEHLDRLGDVGTDELGDEGSGAPLPASRLVDVMADCLEPHDMFARYGESADRLEAWHRGGRQGPRPAGRLRRLETATASSWRTFVASALLDQVHNPDGRPRDLRRRGEY